MGTGIAGRVIGKDMAYVAAIFHRARHRHLVGVFEVGADGNPHRDPRHADAERLQQPRQIERGRFALDGRIGRDDHFVRLPLAHARQQSLDLQIVGTDAVQRRQRAHQHVIDAAELARLLDDRDVLRLLDDADQPLVAGRAGAERAGIGVGDVIARRAVGDALLDVADGVAQPLGILARRAQDVEREPLRALGADAGQLLQLLDEADEGSGRDTMWSIPNSQLPTSRKEGREVGSWTLGVGSYPGLHRITGPGSSGRRSCRTSTVRAARRPCGSRR